MPYNFYFLQIQKDLQAAAFAVRDPDSNGFIKKSYYKSLSDNVTFMVRLRTTFWADEKISGSEKPELTFA